MVIRTKECFKNRSTFSWKPAVFICNFYWQTWRPVNAFLGISQKVIHPGKRLCFSCSVYLSLKGPPGRNMPPVAESPKSQVTSGPRKNVPDPRLGRCSAGRDRPRQVSGRAKAAAARERREPAPSGAPFQPRGPQPTRLPREAREGKGRSSAGLRSPGERRGDRDVKPRAAGGARSTRSIGGRARSSRGARLARRWGAPSRGARPGAAQRSGGPRRSLLSCLCQPGSGEREETGRGPRATALRSRGLGASDLGEARCAEPSAI